MYTTGETIIVEKTIRSVFHDNACNPLLYCISFPISLALQNVSWRILPIE